MIMNSQSPGDTQSSPPVLELDQVSFRRRGETSIHMDRFSASVRAGQLIKLGLMRRHDPRDLVSLLIGLHHPHAGTIRYRGRDWLGLNYSRHFRMRSRIGRVFAGSAWVQSLTVRDNIRLAMSHHGVDKTQIKAQLNEWVERLSGSRVPEVRHALRNRPSFVEPSVLQICQFIRAFIHQPKLLIFERPLRYLVDEAQSNLVAAIEDLRSGGTSVLWFTGDGADPEVSFQGAVSHWTLTNDTLCGDDHFREGDSHNQHGGTIA